MADYPSAIFSPIAKAEGNNLGAIPDWNPALAEIVAIQTALGTNPRLVTNHAYNVAMVFAQRGVSFTDPAVGTYTLDRWRVRNKTGSSVVPVVDIAQGTGAPWAATAKFLSIDITTAGIGAPQYLIHQKLEDHPEWNGLKMTFAADVHATVASKIRLQFNDSAGGSDVSPLHTGDSTIQRLSVTRASVTGLAVELIIAVDPADVITEFRVTNCTLAFGDNGPIIPIDFCIDLARCQRFFEKSYNQTIIPGSATAVGIEVSMLTGVVTNASLWGKNTIFKVTKRTTPTLVVYALDGTLGSWRIGGVNRITGISNAGETGFQGNNGTGGSIGALDDQVLGQWTADAEL